MTDHVPPSIGTAREPFLPDDWKALEPLVDLVLDTPPERRAAVLTEVSAGDAGRRAALERLVAECERDVPLLDRPAAEQFDRLLDEHVEVPLPEILGGRYRIGREVGRGGMARVYLAHDIKHARDVAVKVIRPELAASLGRDRFLEEIAIAARLRHPNIVPLYDSGDADGVLYFVMPYEEGPSLRTRLSAEQVLPIAESVSALRDIARALSYAHERGVVHRDVKPDNVMMSGGAAVVADFGIAKAVSVAQSTPLGEVSPVGRTSTAVGTPAYMAPEQQAGDPSMDHRADIYSFGCLAYELFTGNVPFPEQSAESVGALHAIAAPQAVSSLRADVPPALADLVSRCLEKNPAARPQSARAVLDVLDAADPRGATTRSLTTWRAALPWRRAALAAVAVAATVYVSTRASADPVPLTLAVLPLRVFSGDTAVVNQGIGDDVAEALSRVSGIQIKSRIGARAYGGRDDVDLAEAGIRLKADYLITGVVRHEQGRWRLSADLARASDGTSLWAESFTVSPGQQVGTGEIVAGKVVAALRSRFPGVVGSLPPLASNQTTTSAEAARHNDLGQEKLSRRRQGVEDAANHFRRAIREDSNYAKAHSGLSMALALYPNHQAYAVDSISDELVGAARRAIALDPTLAQPHIALGMAHGFNYEWDSAAVEFLTAIRLEERNVEARIQYGRHLRNRGRVPQAIVQLRAARLQDPASALVLSQLSYAYYLDRQLDSAFAESVRALENDPLNRTSLVLGALVRLAIDRRAEARVLIEKSPETSPFKAYVIAKSGDVATARQLLAQHDAERPQPGLAETRRAYTYLGLGDTAQALSALERATDAREVWPVLESYLDPVHDPIRDSPRYKTLLRRVRLGL